MADQKTAGKPSRAPAKKAAQDDDVVGKVYDGRLMRRLLIEQNFSLAVAAGQIEGIYRAALEARYSVRNAGAAEGSGVSR